MANIPLQSISFPGLSDKYTTPVVDNTLTQAGAAADAKKVGDEVGAIKNDLSEFPNGNYPQMGAGYANQLVSGLKKEDSVPYNFRAVPYDATLEEVKKIVGGTVVNNQLFNFPQQNTSNGVTLTFENGVVTLSGTATSGYCSFFTARITGGHKILVDTKVVNNPDNLTITFGSLNAQGRATIGSSSITNANNLAYASGIGIEGYGGTGTVFNNVKFQCYCTDLTQMLGTAIADYVYSLETATAGAGVAWLKTHFPKQFDAGYRAYDTGTLKSIEGLSGKKTVGFNQWDEQWEAGSFNSSNGKKTEISGRIRTKNYIPVVPNTNYYVFVGNGYGKSALGTVCYYDADKNFVSAAYPDANTQITTPNNACYMMIGFYASYGTTYNHDICINLSNPTKNGTYEPYEAHSYALDSDVVLRGIPKLNSNNKLYYDGDEYLPDGTVIRNIKVYTPIESNILYAPNNSGYANIAYARITKPNDAKAFNSASYFPLLVEGYPLSDATTNWDSAENIGYAFYGADTATWWVGFAHGTTLEQMKTALVGKTVLYAATPTTETADPYTTPQFISPNGTEEYIYEDGAFELPVGHSTDYPVDVSGQLDDILDTPSANGTYVLKATVTDGAVSYSWVADA